jgi:lysozyme family protein
MPSFNDAVEKVLKHEGNYNNVNKVIKGQLTVDKGGRTNWGITQKVYEEFLGRKLVGPLTDALKGQPMSEAETVMRNMPRGNAIIIYKKEYWDRVQGDKIKSYATAFQLFDQAVNRGVPSAVKQAQKILGITVDGVAGPNYLTALNKMTSVSTGEKSFLDKYLGASELFYRNAAKDPTQAGFLVGWLARVASIKSYAEKNLNAKVVASGIGTVILVAGAFFLIYKYRSSLFNNKGIVNA